MIDAENSNGKQEQIIENDSDLKTDSFSKKRITHRFKIDKQNISIMYTLHNILINIRKNVFPFSFQGIIIKKAKS